MKRILLRLLFILVIVSCEEPITFSEPQPAKTKSLAKFPSSLCGKYLSLDKESYVTINPKNMTVIYDYDVKVVKDSLDKKYWLKGDTLFLDSTGTYEIVSIKNDTIIKHIYQTDTLFEVCNTNVLKKFKGHFFLNYPWLHNEWIVRELTLVKGILSIADINTKDGLLLLNEIKETPNDTMSYGIKISKRQFKDFLKVDGFHEAKYYVKVR